MNYIFDFDGTIISKLNINYTKLKNELKHILNYDGELTPMFDKINELSKDKFQKQKCFYLIDKYELEALKNIKINKEIIDIYLKSKYKIILSRNGNKVINKFFNDYQINKPHFISCRDNCTRLKPNIQQIEIIMHKFKDLNKNNITMVGDSWHDEKLAKNIGCQYLKIMF